jgi:hypothetical protein
MDGNTMPTTTAASSAVQVKDVAEDERLRSEDQDAKQRQHLREMKQLEEKYSSQHYSSGANEYFEVNQLFDTIGLEGVLTMVPSYKSGINPNFFEEYYKSGINPNFFEEYFSELGPSDVTNTAEGKTAIWKEYQDRRWSYCQHLAGYHDGIIQKTNQEVGTVEFWRRFHLRTQPPPSVIEWNFDNRRKIGDVLPSDLSIPEYLDGVSDVLYPNFSNCPVPPKQTLTLGTVHIAVGFVDLGLLLDSRFSEPEAESPSARLLFRGFEASSFAVAKSLVIWEMLRTSGTKASWVVQVWFSAIWSKRATNAFLAAARRVAAVDCSKPTVDYPPGSVCSCNTGLIPREWGLRSWSNVVVALARNHPMHCFSHARTIGLR